MKNYNIVEEPLSGTKAKNLVADTKGKCIVRFWAPWCTPCRANKETINKTLQHTGIDYKVFSINVDREPELTRLMGIKYIPETIIYDKKRNKHHLTGELTTQDIIKLIG